ncbi:Aldo/keto reductase [Thozetella sp. PMI_491]|nr:Aldo/keto reductase [Thozetella sp. PMI_491]
MSLPPPSFIRPLGKDGPKIPAIGIGLMGMSIGYGPAAPDEERLKLLDHAWEIGCTNWDTADIYGDSEDLIGKWFKLHPERRKDVFLATKFGLRAPTEGVEMDKPSVVEIDSSPVYCKQSIDQSLKRLGVDYIDLYYLHRPDSEIPIEKTIHAMKEIVREGKAKLLGLSEVSSTTLRRAHAIHPISAVQVEYNPWTLDIEGPSGTHLLRTCRELGVSVLAYSPLGRGILTGKIRSNADFGPDDVRARLARFNGDNFKKNLVLVDRFTELAKDKGCTPSQMVLAWLLAQGDDIFVIPGTKNTEHLEDNYGASEVHLTEHEVKQLRELVAAAGVSGDRDPAFGAFVDTAPLKD